MPAAFRQSAPHAAAQALHPNMRAALCDGLDRCLNQGYHAAKVVEYNLKANKKWGARDRRRYAEALYEVVRWKPRLAWAANVPEDRVSALLDAWLALESGEAHKDVQQRWETPPSETVAQAMPAWLAERGAAQFGEDWSQIADCLNTQAPLFLRANSLKADATAVIRALDKEGIEARARGGQALEVRKRQNVFTSAAFKAGLFEVQDLGSQDIAPFLQVEPGMRIIDACAGGGGKSLHLGAMMENKGRLLAMDLHQWKLDALKQRAKRAGLHCAETRRIESSKTIKRLKDSADRVLLDVPCSGSGVLRRKPDTKWKVSEEGFAETLALQADIFARYANMTKPGGKLVYATCSILEEENQAQVAAFLAAHPDWQLEEQSLRLPEQGGSDGFFMARLLRLG